MTKLTRDEELNNLFFNKKTKWKDNLGVWAHMNLLWPSAEDPHLTSRLCDFECLIPSSLPTELYHVLQWFIVIWTTKFSGRYYALVPLTSNIINSSIWSCYSFWMNYNRPSQPITLYLLRFLVIFPINSAAHILPSLPLIHFEYRKNRKDNRSTEIFQCLLWKTNHHGDNPTGLITGLVLYSPKWIMRPSY